MRTVRLSKRGKQRANRKRRGNSNPYHAEKAQVQALSGILSNITKLPQIIKTIVQFAPLIRVFMNSFLKSDSAAPALPPGNENSAGAEKTINPVADNESIDKEEGFNDQIQTKEAPILKSRKQKRRHMPLKRR